ncbi:uncharacterized protein LOC141664988 [Apium graveolens]|uniref:uncharacterized protein LOC141664988 n=1 Tax=Apium graveolens TaxID=4045 RepID=UPI003D7A1D33
MEAGMEFSIWLKNRLAGQTKENKAKIITLCWSIWRARNDLLWNGKRWKELRIVANAWEYLSQWRITQNRGMQAPLYPDFPGDGAVIWGKPHYNEGKISVDAAVFEEQGKSGIGLIARNHEGWLIAAKTRSFAEVMNPSLVETIAIKEALSWAKEWDSTTVTIESDCLAVVLMVRSSAPMRSRVGQVVEECRNLVRDVNNVKLYFVKLTCRPMSLLECHMCILCVS